MNFESLSLDKQLIAALAGLGIDSANPIQELVIPAALEHKNLLVSSQTGSGKTLAYLLPLLQQLMTRSPKGSIEALILAPTRELAQQIGSVASSLVGRELLTVIVGGVEYEPQRKALALAVRIVIATPGRFIDLLEQGAVGVCAPDFFILDEVDQMVDLGFRESIERLAALRHAESQTLCFSATLPTEVVEIVEQIAPQIERIGLAEEPLSVEHLEQRGYCVTLPLMDGLLLHLLKVESPSQAIIFTRSRKMADRVVEVLVANGFEAEAMHSDRSQAAREHILGRFREGETRILVATDVVARGIDISALSHIFNFGLPQSAEQYIHRCGRTARAGRAGCALTLFTPDEKPMVDQICRLIKRHIVIDTTHPYMTPEVTLALSGRRAKRARR